jgi:hypothetical protein
VRLITTVSSAALAGALLLVGAAPATADPNDIGVTVPQRSTGNFGDITNAELRWGLNNESSGGSFAGGCNFLSAGTAGNSGSARVWEESDKLYASSDGDVTIEKATADGGWTEASFGARCLDTSGSPVSVTSNDSTTQSVVVMEAGTGSATADALTISWKGSFTVAFYGGMTYWSASDPELTVDASGTGRVTATASGYGTSMDDMTKWVPLAGQTIVLAELRNVPMDGAGFSILPEYLGVASTTGGQIPLTSENAAYWGAFPASFMDFQTLTGQAGYWLSTGGQRDPAKPATALTVNFDANAPAISPSGGAVAGSANSAENSAAQRPTAPGASLPAAAGSGATGPTGDAMTVVRDDGSTFLPEALQGDIPRVLAIIGGIVLAVLVSVLAALQLTGRLTFPWTRPRTGVSPEA